MLFKFISLINKAADLSSIINTKQESDFNNNDDDAVIIDEKKSIFHYNNNNGVFGRIRRTSSNRSLFKISSLMKNWNSSNPSVYSVASVVFPPSLTQVIPLWKEQVDSNIKNSLNPSEIHRQEIMFEIIRTEKDFAEDIRYLNEYFVQSIQSSGIRLPSSLEKTFTIIPYIFLLHFSVSMQLCNIQAIMYPIIPSITHALRELATQFSMYELYLVNYKMAISEIANARKKNNKLGQLVKNLESEIPPGPPGKSLTLESLLTKPFQRLCKYPLLVMRLLRATVTDHEDHAALMDLHNQVDCALRKLQERKSEYERSLENDDFSRKFGSLASNGRDRSYAI